LTFWLVFREKIDEYVKKGEEEYGINAKAFAYFSVKPQADKKYPDLKTPALEMLKDIATVKSAVQVARHLYVELESEEQLNEVHDKFVKQKSIKFDTQGQRFQPFLLKLERTSLSIR
jgi:hypothetical protein